MPDELATAEPERMESNKKARNEMNPLGSMPVGKLLVSFSIPAIATGLIMSVYNIADQIFIGRGVGYLGNAATTVAFPIMTLIFTFAAMCGAGSAAFASIKLGEKRGEIAEQALINGAILSAGIGLILTILGLIFLNPLLRLFGASDEVMPYARDFSFIILFGAPFFTLGMFLSSMARADGSPRLSMYSVLIGAVFNCILNPIYIFVLHWGIKGSAIATVTSQILSVLFLGIYFMKYGKNMKLRFRGFKIDFGIWKKIMSLGLSAAITQGAMTVTQTFMNNALVHFGNLDPLVGGDIALSAMGINSKLVMTIFGFGMGIALGSQPIFGYNLGARLPSRIKKCYILAVGSATVLISVAWLFFQLFPHQIISIFGDEGPGFTNFAVLSLRTFTIGMPLSGFQAVSSQYFQATGQPLKAASIASLRQLILLVPLILILPLFFGLKGVLLAGPAADFLSSIVVFLFMRTELKNLNLWIREGTPPAMVRKSDLALES